MICDNCGKTIENKPLKNENLVFCSDKCMEEKKANPVASNVCEFC